MFETQEYLYNKIISWNQSKADSLHGLAPKGFPTKAKYVWEEANKPDVEGFVFYGPSHATYMNANGEEWILTALQSHDFEKTWTAYSKLYSLASDQNIKMVNPTGLPLNMSNKKKVQKLELDNVSYNYYKLEHPDNELGWQSNPTSNTVDDYFNNLISDTELLMPLIKQTVNVLSVGYPNWRPVDRLENSSGRYHRWMFNWSIEKEEFYFKCIGILEAMIQTYSITMNGFEPSFDVKKKAEEKWKKALNM